MMAIAILKARLRALFLIARLRALFLIARLRARGAVNAGVALAS
jgi:hypothetical protein